MRSKWRFAPTLVLFAAPAFACIVVDRDRVLAKDLAEVNPWFGRFDSELDIGLSPLAGSTRVIRSSELRTLARAHGEAGAVPDSMSRLCIERATEPLTIERLQPVLEAALDGAAAAIIDFSRFRIPRGEIEFTRAGLTPSGLWRGRVNYGQNHTLPIWVRIGAGAESVAAPLAKRHDVERGEQVTVEVTSGAARLAFSATAQSSGSRGESVLVRNPDNGRLLQGQVIASRKVLIHK